MKRSGWRAITSALRAARATIAWCIVGTAVYQVGVRLVHPAEELAAR